jgi:hypothetical protein
MAITCRAVGTQAWRRSCMPLACSWHSSMAAIMNVIGDQHAVGVQNLPFVLKLATSSPSPKQPNLEIARLVVFRD